MKRLLITTAVGLCLAAPAFAQSTTDQDQLNKQRANQPSTSAPSNPAAPSSSSNTNSQGSTQSGTQRQQTSPSAQAPSQNQNQRGQAQNERQPSGSSSTNAQAPSSSSSSSTTAQTPSSSSQSSQSATDTKSKQNSNRAQNRKEPSGSSAQAPSGLAESSRTGQAQNRDMRNDSRDSRASRSDRASAGLNVNINDQQRTRIAAVIGNSRARPVNVNFRLDVGTRVPRTIALHTLPASIVEIVPAYRGYRYFLAQDQIVIVEPRRQTIVAVLPAGGGTARAQATSDRVRFTDQQRDVIRSRASSLRSVETTGSATHYVVEEEIPATVELQEFPAEIVTEVPTVRTYRYFRQDNDVVVVDPTRRRVIEVIR